MYIEQSNQSHIVANGSDACEMAHVLILFNFFLFATMFYLELLFVCTDIAQI